MALLHVVVLAPVAWWIVFRVYGDARWWLFLINTFALYLFPVAILAALAAIPLRARSVAVSALVTVGLAATLYGGRLPPLGGASALAAPVDARLRLLTFNVNVDNPDPEGVARALATTDADVIALQELTLPVARALERALGERFPYRAFEASNTWSGIGVMSRFPLTRLDLRLDGSGSDDPQVLQIDLPSGPVTLVNVHNLSTPRYAPAWPADITRAMHQRVGVARDVARVARERGSLIVLGDFNTTERSTAYRLITAELFDAWREAGHGFGFTYPGGPKRPSPLGLYVPAWLLRIDFLFHSSDWRAVQAAVGPWDAHSDHRALQVTLARVPPPSER